MRGRSCTQPFLVEKSACRPDTFLLPPRWVSRSPPHPPQCAHWGTYGLWWLRLDLTEQSPGLFDPQGEGFGSEKDPSRLRNPPFPARPAGGRAVTGVGSWAAGQAKKKESPSQSPQPEKVGPGRKNLFLPGVLSSGFLPKKAGLPRGRRRGTHVAGSTLQRFQRNRLPMTEAPRPHLAACGQVPSGKWAQKPPRPVGVWGA